MKQRSGLPNPVTSSPVFRRRRRIWLLLAFIVFAFLFFSSSFPLHPSNLFGSSVESDALHRDILELHGLQHFVLNSELSLHEVLFKANRDRPDGVPVHDHVREGNSDGDGAPDAEHERLDPTKEIDLKVYSSFDGDDNWVKHVKELETNSPLVVFSKVPSAQSFMFSEPVLLVVRPGCHPHRGATFRSLFPTLTSYLFNPSEESESDVYRSFHAYHHYRPFHLTVCGNT